MGRLNYDEMRRLRDAGVRNDDIAQRMGCSVETVRWAVKKFGWPHRTPGQPRPIDVPALFRMWHSEMATADIAIAVGVSMSTLHTLSKRHKLPKRRVRRVALKDPTPDEIERRARECRERHYAERRGETDQTTLEWRRDGAA